MVASQALANTILASAFNERVSVSPMKLQKLMYFICRDWAKSHDTPLVSEDFKAWEYGPVIPSIYDEFKSFGSRPIQKFARNSQNEVFVIEEKDDFPIIFDQVWNRYKYRTGIDLSKITHGKDGAWRKAYQKGVGETISFDDMRSDNAY